MALRLELSNAEGSLLFSSATVYKMSWAKGLFVGEGEGVGGGLRAVQHDYLSGTLFSVVAERTRNFSRFFDQHPHGRKWHFLVVLSCIYPV